LLFPVAIKAALVAVASTVETGKGGASSSEGGNHMRRSTVLLLLAVGMLIVWSGTASAQRPAAETDSFSYSDSSSCGSFNDNFAGNGTVRDTTFFDSGGNPVREHIRVSVRETDVNSRSGKTIQVHQAYAVVVNLETGFYAYNGQVYMSTGPHRSGLIHDTGHVLFDPEGNVIKQAGPHTVLAGGLAPFCQALS
jgi:hypothetical protein